MWFISLFKQLPSRQKVEEIIYWGHNHSLSRANTTLLMWTILFYILVFKIIWYHLIPIIKGFIYKFDIIFVR